MGNIEEYVDLEQLEIWKKFLEEYNSQCLQLIDSFVQLSLKLQGIWTGDAASHFDENFQKQLNTAKNHHNELRDVTSFLSTFAEMMKNE